jgi:hypothetical protein
MEYHMKIALALVAAFIVGGIATPSSAQVISASQVLSDCPDVPAAQACPGLATAFLGNAAPTTRRDGRIVNLVVAIAEAAQQPRVPRRSCLNAADGLRVLATGVTTDEQAQQINDIADALCRGSRTAAIGGPRRLFGPFESLSGQSSGGGGGAGGSGGTTTTPPVIIDPPGGGGGGEGCEPNCPPVGSTGTLGSHGAAKSPNQNALDNANDNAKNNTSGQNNQAPGQQQSSAPQSQTSSEEGEKSTGSDNKPVGSDNKPADAGPPEVKGNPNKP